MSVEGHEAAAKRRKKRRKRGKKKETRQSRTAEEKATTTAAALCAAASSGADDKRDVAQRPPPVSRGGDDAGPPDTAVCPSDDSGAAASDTGLGTIDARVVKNERTKNSGEEAGDVDADAAAEKRRLIKKKRRRDRKKNTKRRRGEEQVTGGDGGDVKRNESPKKKTAAAAIEETKPSTEPTAAGDAPRRVDRGPPAQKKPRGAPRPAAAEKCTPSAAGNSSKHDDARQSSKNGGGGGPPPPPTTTPGAAASTARPRHPFAADEADHCETPLSAYRDVAPLLDKIAASIGKTRSTLVVYDPYYCAGGIKTKLGSLGFHCVINECCDFYQDVREGTVPEHDVLVTNPPYSADHMERLMRFVVSAGGPCEAKASAGGSRGRTPFLLLLPHYVYTKPYYRDAFPQSDEGGGGSGGGSGGGTNPFYLVPRSRYAYLPPGWVSSEKGGSAVVGKGRKVDTAPFPSFWYCSVVSSPGRGGGGGGGSMDTNVRAWMARTYGPSGVYKAGGGGAGGSKGGTMMQYAERAAHIPREFKGEFDSTKKRPNPRARKRMMAKKRANGGV